jgi:eukaryotic-like serine/threonine-protein kinase
MDRSPPLEQRLLGQTLAGKYRLVEVQAAGAFGTVFQAHQYFCNQFMRPVAVKVSRQTGLSDETAPYLFGDALILARLLAGGSAGAGDEGRRHLVHIYDMGLLPEHDDRAFLVMEYVDGAPLLSHMRAAGRVSVAIGLRFVKQICRAMALVHGQGAVHRDLKSDNILVDRRGVVRVVDFGLAAFADRRLGFAPGSMGTFTYMAPETLQGRSTPASDVYSLGLLLYELFTGGGPHLTAPWPTDDKDERRDVYFRIKTGLSFPPPSEVQNEIRNDYRWLDALILRCLEADPGRRFIDAGKLLAAIEACQVGEELPPLEPVAPPVAHAPGSPAPVADAPGSRTQGADTPRSPDALFREVRRLMACRAFDQVIDRLDVHRPAEWAVVDLTGARTLRALGQAYLGLGDLAAARDCLEQLRTTQREQGLLPRPDYAAALSDLFKCYRGLGQMELAQACQEEARRLL